MNVEKLVLEEEYKNNGNSGMDRVVLAKFLFVQRVDLYLSI